MNIYELNVVEGYEWVVPASDTDHELLRILEGKSVSGSWEPPKVVLIHEDEAGKPLKQSDMPWYSKALPVVRPSALAILRELLADDGEFLELSCSEAELWVFNATRLLDALDETRSRILRFPGSDRIMKIDQHVFRADAVGGAKAFKIPQMPRGPVFFSDAVAKHVGADSLHGFSFRPVWATNATADQGQSR